MSAEEAPKRVLVTGGGRGIGAAIARLAGARGWRVAINYHSDAAAAQATADAVIQAGGAAILAQGDVASPDAVVSVFDASEAALGGLDAVVVNAGVIAPRLTLAEMEPERIRHVVETNVLGALFCAREAARRVVDGGSILFMSSAASRIGSANEFVDYAASKGAIDTLTRGLAVELGPRGVRVNAIRPGLIDTDINAATGWPDRARVLGANTPLGREGAPEEIAEAAIWLLSDAASYASGAHLDISGGR